MWAELESTEKEGITIQGYCTYNPGQLQLVTAFLHVADTAKPQCSLSAGLKRAHRPELPLRYLKLHRWLVKFN